MLTSVYDAHENNDKRVIGIAQLYLSDLLIKVLEYSENFLTLTLSNLRQFASTIIMI